MQVNLSADYFIEKLNLTVHPEGGCFRETYRSKMVIQPNASFSRINEPRNVSTSIYFLLKADTFSAFHRIASDELWHFYEGYSLTVYEIRQTGELIAHKLGRNLEEGEQFQTMIQAGSWFASRCETENGFSLVGCTVAPGFEFNDFELAKKQELLSKYPQHSGIINELCLD